MLALTRPAQSSGTLAIFAAIRRASNALMIYWVLRDNPH
jgi:hypothetical protein